MLSIDTQVHVLRIQIICLDSSVLRNVYCPYMKHGDVEGFLMCLYVTFMQNNPYLQNIFGRRTSSRLPVFNEQISPTSDTQSP